MANSVNVRKSKGRKMKNSVKNEDHGSGIGRKLKFLFCWLSFGVRSKDSESGDINLNTKDEFSLVKKEEKLSSKKKEVKRLEIMNNSHSKEIGEVVEEDQKVAKSTVSSTSSNSVAVPPFTPKLSLRNFSYNEIIGATMNFKRENFLGEGGFGRVFKGWITENENDEMSPTLHGIGVPVAVKTLNLAGLQGHTQWLAEVNYLSQLQHPNLIKLIGFCNEGDQRILVYEYMPRGSLDSHLFRRMKTPLPWSTRMRIMLDAAQGLAYLHQSDDKNAVIYRDFKTSNVLLDQDFNAKLSDFGLAKEGPEGDKTHVSTTVMGTQGYTAPEYVLTGRVSTKSDVYSFGVVLLEMITGRKAFDRSKPSNEVVLVKWAVPKIKAGTIMYSHMILVDPRLQGHYSIKGSIRALMLASQCVKKNPLERPNMSKVVEVMKKLPYVLEDMAYQAQSPTNVMVVGGNTISLTVGLSSARNVPLISQIHHLRH